MHTHERKDKKSEERPKEKKKKMYISIPNPCLFPLYANKDRSVKASVLLDN